MKKVFFALSGVSIIVLAIFFIVKSKVGSVNIPPKGDEEADEIISQLKLPPGFEMDVYARGLTDARVIAFDPLGRLAVSQSGEGRVVLVLPNTDIDGSGNKSAILLTGLNLPHGLAFICPEDSRNFPCRLYVAEEHMLSRHDYEPENHLVSNRKELLPLPNGSVGTHTTRSLLILDENTLLISVGSSCNVCREDDPRRASVIAYHIGSNTSEPFASGLRNAVFMDRDPVFGKIFATEMGRDGLGDDIPPDEINILEKGKNYGWPNCYGKNIHDMNFDKNTYIRNPCMIPFETPSFVDLQAHSAPLGLAFIPEEGWPEEWWYDMLVAYHGSWNRSVPTGYKIVRIPMDAKGNVTGAPVDFITGWLASDGSKLGRPVDIKVLSGGTMYISDDMNGIIYKLVHK